MKQNGTLSEQLMNTSQPICVSDVLIDLLICVLKIDSTINTPLLCMHITVPTQLQFTDPEFFLLVDIYNISDLHNAPACLMARPIVAY